MALSTINSQAAPANMKQVGQKKVFKFQVGTKNVEPLDAPKTLNFKTPELMAMYNELKGSVKNMNCANKTKFGKNQALVLNKCLQKKEDNSEILIIKLFHHGEKTQLMWRMSYKKVDVKKADGSLVAVFVGVDCKSLKHELKPSPIMATCESMAFLGSTIVETVSGKMTNNISTNPNDIKKITNLAECIKNKVKNIFSQKKTECWVESLDGKQLEDFLVKVQGKMDNKDLKVVDGKIVSSKTTVTQAAPAKVQKKTLIA